MIDLESIEEISINVEVIMGAVELSLEEFSQIKKGSIIDLNIASGSPSFVLVNGEPIARGEILVFEKNLAIRLSKIYDEDDRIRYSRKYFGT